MRALGEPDHYINLVSLRNRLMYFVLLLLTGRGGIVLMGCFDSLWSELLRGRLQLFDFDFPSFSGRS